MKIKKHIIFILIFSVCFNYVSITAFADKNEISLAEFCNMAQDLIEKYDENGLASVNPSVNNELNRLIVKTETNDPLENYYSAKECVEGYDGLHILQFSTKSQTEYAYNKLKFDGVKYVEYDYYLSLESANEKSESTDITNLHLSWNSAVVNVDEAFEYILNSELICSNITVAVIDTGIYSEHDIFKNSGRIVDSGFIYKEKKTNQENDDYFVHYSSMDDDHYHGTHVCGIVFDNTMNNVKIEPYRVTNSTGVDYVILISAFLAAVERNVDIINMSIAKGNEDESPILYEYVTNAVKNGITVIAAAGNSGNLANTTYPACIPDAITVTATDEFNKPTNFSNYGSVSDIGAPGSNIRSTTPFEFADLDNNGNKNFPSYSAYEIDSGTSMAAPLVAAAAATLKSISPDMSAAEIQRIIKETAYVPEGWDTKYGTGIVNFYNMVKQDVSGKPTIKLNSDGKIEITAPEGTDSRLYYTLDGSIPTIDNHLVYTEPFSISGKNISLITAVCHENGKLIGEAEKYRTNSFHTLKLNYKETVKTINAKAKWYSWNTDVATVDREGNITGVGVGETTVTAVLESGKTISYNVYVKYTPLQRFIRIFLFGFLWY